MKIAIHHRESGFSQKWIDYCKEQDIDYKLVNCYKSNIVDQLGDCDALMWHHHHASPKDTLFAKQLLYSIEVSGKVVFPDFGSNWFFDDKLGQKYLFEAIQAPAVPTYAFYSKGDAIDWADATSFPKVFKLRGGSSSENVQLVRNKTEAIRLINKAFGKGFSLYNARGSIKERWRLYKRDELRLNDVIKGYVRLFMPTEYSKIQGRERGYVYFQDFIPDNDSDVRIAYVNNRCFGYRRKVRQGDFRASGGHMNSYNRSQVPETALKIAFDVANRLKLQGAAFDFVFQNGEPLIVELSYGFGALDVVGKHGYWDRNMKFYPGTFNPYGWMVNIVIDQVNRKE